MDRKGNDVKSATGQHARFIEAARQVGADDNTEAFKAKLAVIARQKVTDVPEPPAGDKP